MSISPSHLGAEPGAAAAQLDFRSQDERLLSSAWPEQTLLPSLTEEEGGRKVPAGSAQSATVRATVLRHPPNGKVCKRSNAVAQFDCIE